MEHGTSTNDIKVKQAETFNSKQTQNKKRNAPPSTKSAE